MTRPLLANIDSDEEDDIPKKKKDPTPKKAVAQSPLLGREGSVKPSPVVTPRKTPRDLIPAGSEQKKGGLGGIFGKGVAFFNKRENKSA